MFWKTKSKKRSDDHNQERNSVWCDPTETQKRKGFEYCLICEKSVYSRKKSVMKDNLKGGETTHQGHLGFPNVL